ncbi:type II toxin-antitoxin system VapC family toxin [Candidatus Nanohalobium constans]|uniref:Putative RNA-binding protein containing PIN domain n=1 Tax=Candidatus Nanohalobium constans TaxID=2565781 RepID=A0A5Q0UGG4_9ARCH|nr:PIN domain-containing protein [Candidatus Nanohalobium constans]QGA80666.1 putative RNA-binding protein containing PIN domain [Candidatus Nanohalobium constans]
MSREIILDTNFLTAPFQLDSIDIFQEIERIFPNSEIYTIDDALQEAQSIEQGKYGNLVEKLIEKKDIEVLETEGQGEVDDLLVQISRDYVIATNDRELKERLLEVNAEVIHIRNESYLEVLNRKDPGF